MSCLQKPIFQNAVGPYDNPLPSPETVQRILTERLQEVKDRACNIVLLVGPARSGTTALQMLAAQLEHTRYAEFQPIKDIHRRLGANTSTALLFPEPLKDGDTLFVKETVGPQHPFECIMDPGDMFLKAGISPERIRAIYLQRDPEKVLDSWRKFVTVGTQELDVVLQTLTQSFQKNRERIRMCIPFSYEMLEHDTAGVLTRLFRAAGLDDPDPSLRFDQELLGRTATGKMRWNAATQQNYWDPVIAPTLARGQFAYAPTGVTRIDADESAFIQKTFVPMYKAWTADAMHLLAMTP